MRYVLSLSKIFILLGVISALLAVLLGGPGFLTLFLTIGQVFFIIGILIYLGVVIRDLKDKEII